MAVLMKFVAFDIKKIFLQNFKKSEFFIVLKK